MEPGDAPLTGGFEERLRPEDVRAEEQTRVEYRQTVVRLGCEVHDHVNTVVAEQEVDEIELTDVALDELDVLAEAGQVGQVPRVGERVEDDDAVFWMPLGPVPHKVRPDEAGATGDEEAPTHVRNPMCGRARGSRSAHCGLF
jgi:hypothetical protein